MNNNYNQNGMSNSPIQNSQPQVYQNGNQPTNPPKNQKKMIIIAIIVVLAIIIALYFLLFSDKKENSNFNTNNTPQTNENLEETKKFKANIRLLTKEEGGRHTAIFTNYRPTFKIDNKEYNGSIQFEEDIEMAMPGDSIFVSVELDSAVSLKDGDEFIILEGGRTVGEGTVSQEKKEHTNSNTNTNTNSQSVKIGKVEPNTNFTYDEKGAFFMYIEDVFSITGRGTVVTGRISRGTVKIGDEVQILGLDGEILTTQIVGIEMFRKEYESAKIGDNIGLVLKDVQRDQIQRGDTVVAPNTMMATTDFEADIKVLSYSKNEGISSGYQPYFAIGPSSCEGIISTNATIKPEEEGKISVRLNSPIAMEVGTKFSIREGGITIAEGKVTKLN